MSKKFNKRKPTILTKNEIEKKENELKLSLHEAETKQLSDYIKTRTKLIDHEIHQTRQKLDIHFDLSDKNYKSMKSSDMEVYGSKPPVKSNDLMEISDKRQSTKLSQQDSYNRGEREVLELLRRLQTCMEDSEMNPGQITQCFLPSQSKASVKGCIPLVEVVDVFEVDLVQPLSQHDQSLLSKFYGTHEGDIDVKALLTDLSFWEPPKGAQDTENGKRINAVHTQNNRHSSLVDDDDDLDADLPTYLKNKRERDSYERLRETHEEESNDYRKTPPQKSRTKDFVPEPVIHRDAAGHAALNRSALADIHALVTESLPPDSFKVDPDYQESTRRKTTYDEVDEEDDEKLLQTLRKEMEKEKNQMNSRKETSDSDVHSDKVSDKFMDQHGDGVLPSPRPKDTEGSKTIEQIAAENVATALAIENAKLKAELSAFDSDFFEELEDLKFKYTQLQGIVGDQAVPKSPPRKKEANSDDARDEVAGSIAKLGWSTRNSLKALNRAGLTNPPIRTLPGQYNMTDSIHAPSSPLRNRHSPTRRSYDSRTRNFQHSSTAPTSHLLSSFDFNSSSGNNFSGLCERRLVFELQNHTNPAKATSTLIHRISNIAHSEKAKGYITASQLHDAMRGVGLSMSREEVDLLASGFASNGEGGVDAKELCRAIQTMMYNAVDTESAPDGNVDRVVKSIVRSIATDLLAHKNYSQLLRLRDDLHSIGGRSTSRVMEKVEMQLNDTVSKPFLYMDDNDNGILTAKGFVKILRHFSHGLPDDELHVLIEYWLVGNEDENENALHNRTPKHCVYYKPFISLLVEELLDILLDEKIVIKNYGDGTEYDNEVAYDMGGTMPWLLHEFEFVDTLLCQLEDLDMSARRKRLIQLQSVLSSHASMDGDEGGSVDGYAVLKALLSVGFEVPRNLRVQFLQGVEQLSGVFNFVDLCKLLMSACLDWSSEERMVVGKVLHAMGITTDQRRLWLGRLKKDLYTTAVEQRAVKGAQSVRSKRTQRTLRDGLLLTAEDDLLEAERDVVRGISEENPGLPASAFLHTLRECGVNLTVDEEATLLDCLDFEEKSRSIVESGMQQPLLSRSEKISASAPLIRYKSFVALCERHVGKWYHAAPEINEQLKAALMNLKESDAADSISELQSLLLAFDEGDAHSIGYRPFLVTCRRSRLLGKLDSSVIEELAKILLEEGSGKIEYFPFLLHLRSLHHQVRKLKALSRTILEGTKAESYDMLNQLLRNASDREDSTLRPLRHFVIEQSLRASRHQYMGDRQVESENNSFELSQREASELLREFNVVYSAEDWDTFREDVRASSAIRDYFAESQACPLHLHEDAERIASKENGTINATDIIHCLQQLRPAWPKRNPRLAMKIKKMLSRVATSAVEKLLVRLKAFSRAASGESAGGYDDDDDERIPSNTPSVEHRLVGAFAPKEVFSRVLRKCGLPLTQDEIYFLCDESDPHPRARYVRIGVLLEALCESEDSNSVKQQLQNIGSTMQRNREQRSTSSRPKSKRVDDSDGAVFAMEHLKSLLWNAADKLRRRPNEWINDVSSMMRGFDRGGGVCTPEDFVLGMRLLSVRLSSDILQSIPRVSASVDMIPFQLILDVVLDCYDENEGFSPSSPDTNKKLSKRTERNLSVDERKYTAASPRRPYSTWQRSSSRGVKADSVEEERQVAVKSLIDIVRRRLNIFIGDNKDVEHAWSTLLTVFSKFDPDGDHVVSPRDFCLAVSVLMDGDSPVFTKDQWEDVIFYFQDTPDSKVGKMSPRTARRKVGKVNYISFLDMVLDASPVTGSSRHKPPAWMTGTGTKSNLGNSGSSRGAGRSSSPWKPSGVNYRPNRTTGTLASSTTGHKVRASSTGTISRFNNAGKSSLKSNTGKQKKPKKFSVSYAPDSFSSAYYEEDEDEYRESSTMSGRGVAGANLKNTARARELAYTPAPRTQSKYDEIFGTVDASGSVISGGGSISAKQMEFINEFDGFAVKELNSELSDVLAVKMSAAKGQTMKDLLLKYLTMEDKNNSGTLNKHSTLAALNALGVAYHFWSKPSMKSLLEQLVKKGNGSVVIKDFMKLIYL